MSLFQIHYRLLLYTVQHCIVSAGDLYIRFTVEVIVLCKSYGSALPAIGMFSLHQNRLPAVIGVVTFLGLLLGLVCVYVSRTCFCFCVYFG